MDIFSIFNWYFFHSSLKNIFILSKADFNSLQQDKEPIEETFKYEFPKWNKVDLINQSLHYIDLAADRIHPGIESHKLIARDMLKSVKGTNND